MSTLRLHTTQIYCLLITYEGNTRRTFSWKFKWALSQPSWYLVLSDKQDFLLMLVTYSFLLNWICIYLRRFAIIICIYSNDLIVKHSHENHSFNSAKLQLHWKILSKNCEYKSKFKFYFYIPNKSTFLVVVIMHNLLIAKTLKHHRILHEIKCNC